MSNRVRIIGGEWRSRVISFPSEAGLRPTADRVRETLFNWLGQTLEGKACLDLFAGSGALGFEACSRGASQVKLIEHNPKVVAALRDNAQKLGATRAEIIRADGAAWLRADAGVYDVIFLDPPFQAGLLDKLLPLLPAKLSPEGCAYVESGAAIEPPPGMMLLKSGRAGQVHFGLFKKAEHA
ncbi:MAG: 16S rRNA (guanine(966)-N(2))-methyltransferase RsmD [Pseudomonadota bacterium]